MVDERDCTTSSGKAGILPEKILPGKCELKHLGYIVDQLGKAGEVFCGAQDPSSTYVTVTHISPAIIVISKEPGET